jgi:carbohydrate kinase (thermoresistant glucokinase family)
MVVVIFGVAGAGKTTVGELLARELGWKFYDADDFHSRANINKMRSGQALTDADREPWLTRLSELIEQTLAANENAVLACSALKKKYRDHLRVSSKVNFIFLRGSRDRIEEQLKNRRGHYFDPKLLDTQFADLEEPTPDEKVVTVNLGRSPSDVVAEIIEKLQLGK